MKIRFTLAVLVIFVGIMFVVGGCRSSSDVGRDHNDTVEPPSETGTTRYAGLYYQYKNTLGSMQVLIETDVGVDNNYNHRRIHFEYPSSCNEPNWSYSYRDYDFWPSVGVHGHSGIPNKQDRRLFTVDVDNLTPDCFYDVRFRYRDYASGDNWHETWGHFHSTPLTDGFDPSKSASELEFYALGDTRITGDSSRDDVDDVFEAMWDHSGKKTFFLHSGDIVYNGGSPVGWYRYKENCADSIPHDHNNDNWYKNYFGHTDDLSHVWEVLRHMPMFPVIGNHDIQVNACSGSYYNYGSGTSIARINPNAYNYHYYFGNYSHNNEELPEHQYWFRAYGPLLIWGLTAYEGVFQDSFCLKENKNFRPLEEGGTGQYEWLKASLEKHATDVRQWKIVMLHTPIYDPDGGCSNQEDAQTYLKPLFEKYGVDLVVSGHEHFYARKTVNDIPYLILGGGGAGLGLSQKCKDNPQCSGFDLVKNKHHFAFFDIKDDIMKCSIIGKDKKSFDSFTVDRTPKANFDFTPKQSDALPMTVKFSDTSTGNRYKHEWDFGDGHTSEGLGIDASTQHTYEKKGNYTVKLTITSATGSNTKTCNNCVFAGQPMADFDGAPLEGDLPLSVQFQDKSEGNNLSWLWDFGDGKSSIEQNPVNIYQQNGMHRVKLTVSDAADSSNTKTRSEYVKVEPFAAFQYMVSENEMDYYRYTIHFYNESKGNNLTYHWDFGDGYSSSEENPSHKYMHLYYDVNLTVTDDAGYKHSIVKRI